MGYLLFINYEECKYFTAGQAIEIRESYSLTMRNVNTQLLSLLQIAGAQRYSLTMRNVNDDKWVGSWKPKTGYSLTMRNVN